MQLPMGSDVQGGNGWTEGNIPIFYRQSRQRLYLSPPWFIPPRPYSQAEMAIAIRDAIQSSILVTNGTTLHANARWRTAAGSPAGSCRTVPCGAAVVSRVRRQRQ